MPSINNLYYSWLKQELGLPDTDLSAAELEQLLYGNTGASLSSNRRVKVGNYQPVALSGGSSNFTPVLNDLNAFPFPVGESQAYDRVAFAVSTAFAATAVARLGIYSSDADGAPSTLLFESGTIDVTTTGTKEAVIALTLSKGLYWLALVHQVVITTGIDRGIGASLSEFMQFSDANMSGNPSGFTKAGIAGALPNPFAPAFSGAGVFSGASPRLSLRAA